MNSIKRSSPIQHFAHHEVPTDVEKLLRAARAGSHSAFSDLQNIYARRLYKRILSMTRNREDAEDALQDAFLCAYRALPAFEGRSSFSTWLTKIAINSTLMILRKRRHRQESLLEPQSGAEENGPPLDIRDSALSPEELCDQRQRCDAMLNAIQRLDPILKNALNIRIAHDNSIKEIADRLGVSSAAVKARLHRARQLLVKSQYFRDRVTRLNTTRSKGLIGDREGWENVA